MHDYYLAGKDNAADQAAAEAIIKVNPELVPSAHANRVFLSRVIRYLAAEALGLGNAIRGVLRAVRQCLRV
jgi:S-adenosyl methyltransferase